MKPEKPANIPPKKGAERHCGGCKTAYRSRRTADPGKYLGTLTGVLTLWISRKSFRTTISEWGRGPPVYSSSIRKCDNWRGHHFSSRAMDCDDRVYPFAVLWGLHSALSVQSGFRRAGVQTSNEFCLYRKFKKILTDPLCAIRAVPPLPPGPRFPHMTCLGFCVEE